MNCKSFDFIMQDLARDEIVNEPVRRAALLHAEQCGRCRSVLLDETALVASLRALAETTENCQAPDHLEAELRAGFRSRIGALSRDASPGGRTRAPGRLLRRWGAMAAMAVLGAMIPLALSRWAQMHGTPQANVPGSHAARSGPEAPAAGRVEVKNGHSAVPGSSVLKSPVGAPTRPGQEPRRMRRSILPTARRNPDVRYLAQRTVRDKQSGKGESLVASSSDTEVATDFLPVSYGADSIPLEGGQVFRVSMPRSTLLTFGLPMNVDRVGEPIQADVLLGLDGRARAVRFVNRIGNR
ncbi:MAG TPA: hypothetical protein VGQ81_05365 [Acidobacteriota bacterium]|jgi:hypothetical protein|nr:hypothetical protein [Acidobacteriota bacterium]